MNYEAIEVLSRYCVKHIPRRVKDMTVNLFVSSASVGGLVGSVRRGEKRREERSERRREERRAVILDYIASYPAVELK